MGDKIDPKCVKKTQDTLGKIIKKPPLTDKLLSKPPFRFLHDVCTSVIKNTGMMKGLFTDSEMASENVKDKEGKVAFLQKAIDFVSLVLGKALAAKPSKIVAGHEPDKTNEFLQAIGEAVNKKVDNDDYVRRVLTGDTKGGSEKPAEKSEKPKSKDRERSADRHKKPPSQTPGKKEKTSPAASTSAKRREKEDRSKEERSKDSSRDREKRHRDRKDREGSRDRVREKDKSKDKERSRDKDDDRKHRDKEDRHRDREDRDKEDRHKDKEDRHKDREDRHKDREERHKDRERRKKRDEEDKENQEADANQMNGEPEAETGELPARIPRPSSAKGSRRRQHDEEPAGGQLNGHVGEDDLPPQVAASRRVARPSSARPAPPRVKKNEQVPDEPVIVGSSNVPNIISDNKGDSDDDDIFVTKDDDEPQVEPSETVARRQASDSDDDEGGDHGGLVKKIMDTKAQLEHGSQTKEAQVTKKTEIERSSQVSDVQRRKEREMVKKEIEKLRGSIQTLTRSVNPLGKILDFVQEDMDSMQKELDVWKKENRENQVALQREQSITDSSVEPLKAHLGELDNAIKDQLDLIAAVKSNILKNDDKISKMLGSITKS